MTTKHTQGPWLVVPTPEGKYGRNWLEIRAEGGARVVRHCAFSKSRNGEEEFYAGVSISEPDARLIAAAPELLAACEAALGNSHGLDASVAVGLAEAIAKAKGGS